MNVYRQSERSSIARPRSQVRALVGDLAAMLTQQMFFWGCDAQSGGNLLVRLGGERLARDRAVGEGSSRYRWAWQEGAVELHSFCAGWYPASAAASGVIYIRGRERFFECAGGAPLTPGQYDEGDEGLLINATAEEMLVLLRPFLSWIAHYESRLQSAQTLAYRNRCYALYRRQPHHRPWLAPADAQAWLAQFLSSPDTTRRPGKMIT